MKILLINPAPSGTLKAVGVLFPPLGLLYIAAYMEREGYQVAVRDYAVQKKGEEINFKNYDIVGISTDTTRYRQALRFAKKAKRRGCTAVMGGSHDTVETVHETIRFAKRLDTHVAQFSILTPFPGTAICEQVKDRIFRWRGPWSFFDMQHLVFKHDHFPFIRLKWLLFKASLLYYTRSKKGVQDIFHPIKKHRLSIRTLFRFLKDYFWG